MKAPIALITGGAGFVGSHLAERLLEQGSKVIILDNLSTGRYENIAHLEKHPDVTLVIDSLFKESLTGALIRVSDCVFHLASAVVVKLIMEHPVKSIETIFAVPLSCCAIARDFVRASY